MLCRYAPAMGTIWRERKQSGGNSAGSDEMKTDAEKGRFPGPGITAHQASLGSHIPLSTDFEVAVTFDTNRRELWQAGMEAEFPTTPPWVVKWGSIGVLALGLFWLVMDILSGEITEDGEVWMMALIPVLIGLGAFLVAKLRGRDPWRFHVVISSDGVFERRVFESTTPWSKIKRVLERPDSFLFFHGRTFALVPKRVLSHHDVLRIRDIVLTHIHEPERAELLNLPVGCGTIGDGSGDPAGLAGA